ncbi:MAG TPA: zinc metallopeptidase [Terriglobales bacterium]|nr:zinc metallopeptidase [Terriglobales bacterium]
MPYFYFDYTYFILVVPAILFSLWAQARVQSTYAKYSKVHARSAVTGQGAAGSILRENGMADVRIGHVRGKLTDHYDPRTNVVNLSDTVYDSTSIAAIGVAAHETGHALQYAENYLPARLRMTMVPVTRFGANLSMPLILIGFFMQRQPLIDIGLILYSLMFLFQLVTLPVEFNASSRALAAIEAGGILTEGELAGTRKVLNAAALTYVAAMLTSLMSLLRLLILFGGRRRD